MMIPGFFSNASPDYRFGFNGMLRDDDVRDEKLTSVNEGRGNSYDFGARILDPRVGRFLSLDPLMGKFPWQSPYLFAGNNPVNKVDIEGKWAGFVHYYILDNALKGVNPRLVTALQIASDYADSKKYQSQLSSRNHAMMEPGQTKEEYIAGVKGFLKVQMDLYVKSGKISELGMGLHAVMDLTCPTHRGIVWSDDITFDDLIVHSIGDLNYLGINNKEIKEAEKYVQIYFKEAVSQRKQYIKDNPELENKHLFINDLEDRKKQDKIEEENKEKESANSYDNNN